MNNTEIPCFDCPSTMTTVTINHALPSGRNVKDVPALRCPACGSTVLGEEGNAKIDEALKNERVGIRSLEVSDREYQFAHGAAPRGRGNWVFNVKDPATGYDAGETVYAPRMMMFSDAKVWAKAYVRRKLAPKLNAPWLHLEVAP